jgi:hypothetical protein
MKCVPAEDRPTDARLEPPIACHDPTKIKKAVMILMPRKSYAGRAAHIEYRGISTCPRCLNCPVWCGYSIEQSDPNEEATYRQLYHDN